MAKDDGGSAFPINERNCDGGHFYSNLGMTLRDYFAGQVLVGLIDAGTWSGANYTAERARFAYEQADAMIAERAKS
jgi:hypothetical protein